MAGLISGPKAPPQPEVVFIPQSRVQTAQAQFQTASDTDNTNGSNTNGPAQETQSQSQPDEVDQARRASEQRAANLLATQRGRQGTIRTGFTGILEERSTQPRRKTLLGQ